MDIRKVRLTLNDDREIDFTTGGFASPADRIALERQYHISSQALGESGAHEEWILFFIYRVAQRECDDFQGKSFDEFIDALASYDIIEEAQHVAPPTEPAAPIE